VVAICVRWPRSKGVVVLILPAPRYGLALAPCRDESRGDDIGMNAWYGISRINGMEFAGARTSFVASLMERPNFLDYPSALQVHSCRRAIPMCVVLKASGSCRWGGLSVADRDVGISPSHGAQHDAH
jgi:hypothetical protein